MFFISPPFGNYIKLPDTIPIHGSFTIEPRDGLFRQVFLTLRYSFKYNGWVNKIGLRNKGIHYAIENVPKDDIISIAVRNQNDIDEFTKILPNDRNIEINISCPNVQKDNCNTFDLKPLIHEKRKWCIIKIAPYTREKVLDDFYKQGFRQYHCCNTIPVPEGGLSGSSLQKHVKKHIKYLNDKYKDCEIISGGGITDIEDVNEYKKFGAKHFSVSTAFFNPFKFTKLYWNYMNY